MICNLYLIYICLTQIHICDSSPWYEAHRVQYSTVAACVTAERRERHYIRLLSKPALMKASWLQHRWQMQGGQPVMLIFVYATQQVIIKARERSATGWGVDWRGVQSLGDGLSWLKGSGWLSVVYVLLLHRRASMLISPHSCCYTRTEETSPQWFMSCQGRGLASCLTSERALLPWKSHIWAILATWGQSRWQDGILRWSHFHS